MRRFITLAACGAAMVGSSFAQSNAIPGLDARLILLEDPTYFGRRGAAHPGGEACLSYSNYMCNGGTVPIPWLAPGFPPDPMNTDHPKFAFSVVRLGNGRMEQLTGKSTFVKHGHGAGNDPSTCGTCQDPGTGEALGINCSDAYSANTNANRLFLGPSDEIDPWTGVWTATNSLFDRGEPDVGFPANQDGVRSLLSAGFPDPVKNRVTVAESDLLSPGVFFYCMHIVVEGEDGDNRFDNLGYREMLPAWDAAGGSWTFGDGAVPFATGSVLDQWPGAVVNSARNGDDDGHFIVAVKVTSPAAGAFHYEYVVQNLDNSRGAATLRVPLCPSASLSAPGFRDVDTDPLNDWTWSRVGSELVFSAPAGNPLDWNHMFNFWFDTDAAPGNGSVGIDQARPGAGALDVVVQAPVPSIASVAQMGPGCGAPAPTLTGDSPPLLGTAFDLAIQVAPNGGAVLFYSLGPSSQLLAPGCPQFLDPSTLVTVGFQLADGTGAISATVAVPDTPVFDGLAVYWQAAELVVGGPVFGGFAVTNGLHSVLGCR